MKRFATVFLSLIAFTLFAQGQNMGYKQITQEQAKSIIDSQKNIVILDVRTKQEFVAEHIPNSICIPVEEITASDTPPKELKDKNQTVLVYCRSGRRSKIAARHLADMGFKNILEFGGITTWPYDVEK